MKDIKAIYIAGKMQDDDWRRLCFDRTGLTDSHPHKCNPLTAIFTPDEGWPESSDVTVCGLSYTGPFFVDLMGGHGYAYFDDYEHGGNVPDREAYSSRHLADIEYEGQRKKVQQRCLHAIAKADVVLAWIDCIDCYGTIAEIGYAKGLGKIVWIVGPRKYNDLWFVYTLADVSVFMNQGPYGTLKEYLIDLLQEHRGSSPQLYSPIEQAFWDAWLSITANRVYRLVPQYPIGKYRVDFADPIIKTAIELDGHATHSTPDAIAYDRKRQREIEAEGWHVVRFGGKEVFSDVNKCARETLALLRSRYGT